MQEGGVVAVVLSDDAELVRAGGDWVGRVGGRQIGVDGGLRPGEHGLGYDIGVDEVTEVFELMVSWSARYHD